jgi:RHS repeat-associated protein
LRPPCRTGKPVPTFPGKAGQQGNVLAVTGNTGAIEQHFFYTPFGVELEGDASGNPFRYTGRRFDAETGLYDYRARYYDADLGRFLQVDPVGYADQWNLYAYVGNNPLNATDPSGAFQEDRVERAQDLERDVSTASTVADLTRTGVRVIESVTETTAPGSRLLGPASNALMVASEMAERQAEVAGGGQTRPRLP